MVCTVVFAKNDIHFGFIACAKVSNFSKLAKVFPIIYNFLPFNSHTTAIIAILLLSPTMLVLIPLSNSAGGYMFPISFACQTAVLSRRPSPVGADVFWMTKWKTAGSACPEPTCGNRLRVMHSGQLYYCFATFCMLHDLLQPGFVFRNGLADNPLRRGQLADLRGGLPDFPFAVCEIAFGEAPFQACRTPWRCRRRLSAGASRPTVPGERASSFPCALPEYRRK